MTQHITTEWLESIGCKIHGGVALSVNGQSVAWCDFSKSKTWQWIAPKPKPRFRVKAISMKGDVNV
jgi:hypothetical protein